MKRLRKSYKGTRAKERCNRSQYSASRELWEIPMDSGMKPSQKELKERKE